MEIVKIDLEKLDKKIIQKIAKLIRNGKVIIAPTDTVYGLIADARNENAVRKVFEIKNRIFTKPMGVFVGDIKMAKKYVKIKNNQKRILKTADTFIFPIKKHLPFQNDNLGIRISNSELISELLNYLKIPLIQTSANPSGIKLGNNIEEIIQIFEKQDIQPYLILDAGILLEKKPSKVIDLTKTTSQIIRQ